MGLTLSSALGIVAAVATVTTVAIAFFGFVVSLRTKVESDRVVSPAILGVWFSRCTVKFKFWEWRYETTVELPKLALRWHVLSPRFNWEEQRPLSNQLTDMNLLREPGGDPRVACWISFVRDNATKGNPVIQSTAIRRVVDAVDIANGAPRMETTVGDLIRWCMLNGSDPGEIEITKTGENGELPGLYWVSGTLHTAAGTMTLSRPPSMTGSICVGHYSSYDGRTDLFHMASRRQLDRPHAPTQEWADLFLGTFRAYDGVATASWEGLPAWRNLGIERHISPDVTRTRLLKRVGLRGMLGTINMDPNHFQDPNDPEDPDDPNIATSLFISFTTSLAGVIVDGVEVSYPSGIGSARSQGPVYQWKQVRSWLETNVPKELKIVLDRLEPRSAGAVHPLLSLQVPAVSLAFIREVETLAREMVLGARDGEQDRERWMHPEHADRQRIQLFDVVWNITDGKPTNLSLEQQLEMLCQFLIDEFSTPEKARTFLVCKIIRFMLWYPAVSAMYDSTRLWNERSALLMRVELGSN